MYRISGRQGGVFFLSRESWGAWRDSLEFYRGVTWRARAKRLALVLSYPFLRDNCSLEEFSRQVFRATGSRVPLEGDVHGICGILSPTGDKAVVHVPGRGYWKAATGGSHEGVRQEAEIYRLLAEKRPVRFGYSGIRDVCDDGSHVSFWMTEEPGVFLRGRVPTLEEVLPALEEFHSLAPGGLVHGDFKPWNVRWRKDGRPQFFDFESCHAGELSEDIAHWKESLRL